MGFTRALHISFVGVGGGGGGILPKSEVQVFHEKFSLRGGEVGE